MLIDAALSPALAQTLRELGLDAIHVRELHMEREADETILAKAGELGRVLISRDVDFAGLLAQRSRTWPSFVHLRVPGLNAPERQASVIVAAIEQHATDLEGGAILTVQHGRVRVRALPIG